MAVPALGNTPGSCVRERQQRERSISEMPRGFSQLVRRGGLPSPQLVGDDAPIA